MELEERIVREQQRQWKNESGGGLISKDVQRRPIYEDTLESVMFA